MVCENTEIFLLITARSEVCPDHGSHASAIRDEERVTVALVPGNDPGMKAVSDLMRVPAPRPMLMPAAIARRFRLDPG